MRNLMMNFLMMNLLMKKNRKMNLKNRNCFLKLILPMIRRCRMICCLNYKILKTFHCQSFLKELNSFLICCRRSLLRICWEQTNMRNCFCLEQRNMRNCFCLEQMNTRNYFYRYLKNSDYSSESYLTCWC